MSKILVGKLLVQSTRIYHHLHLGLVNILQLLVFVALRFSAEYGLAVCQVTLAHQHGFLTGIGNGYAADSKIEYLRFRQHIGSQRGPRCLYKSYLNTKSLGNLICHINAKAPVTAISLAERQRAIIACSAYKQSASLCYFRYFTFKSGGFSVVAIRTCRKTRRTTKAQYKGNSPDI